MWRWSNHFGQAAKLKVSTKQLGAVLYVLQFLADKITERGQERGSITCLKKGITIK